MQNHTVPVTLRGLKGYAAGFSMLLPEVPRPGDFLTFALKHRRGQGRYAVKSVEWVVARYKEVVVHLEPVTKDRPG